MKTNQAPDKAAENTLQEKSAESAGNVAAAPAFSLDASPAQQKEKEESGDDGGLGTMQMKADGFTGSPPPSDDNTIQRQDDPAATNDTQTGDQSVQIDTPYDITTGPQGLIQTLTNYFGNLENLTFNGRVGLKINLGIGARVLAGAFGVSANGEMDASLGLNIGDDRLVRGSFNLAFAGKAVVEYLWFFKHIESWGYALGRVATFRDIYHFSAHAYTHIMNMYNSLVDEYGDDDSFRMGYGQWDGPGTRNWQALAEKDPTSVHKTTTSRGRTDSFSFNGQIEASYDRGTEHTEAHFYREMDGQTHTKTSSTDVESASGALTINGVGVTVGVTKTGIENDANINNDGQYLNYSISFTNLPSIRNMDSSKLHQTYHLLAGYLGNAGGLANVVRGSADPAATLQLIFSSISESLSNISASGPVSTSNTVTIERNYVAGPTGGDEWVTQYTRLSGGAGVSVSGGQDNVTLATFYKIVDVTGSYGAELSGEASVGAMEFIGEDTLTYLQTIYDSLVYSAADVNAGLATDRFGRWRSYRSAHMMGIKGIIMNLGEPTSNVRKEVGLSDGHPLIAAASASKAAGSVSDGAIQALEDFLHSRRQENVADGQNNVTSPQDFQDSQQNGRTGWYMVAGGMSKVFVDIANQNTPIIKRHRYEPAKQTPSPPVSIMDSLLQEQRVEMELVIQANSTGFFSDALFNETFDLAKNTERNDAVTRIQGKLYNEFKEHERMTDAFKGTHLTDITRGLLQSYLTAGDNITSRGRAGAQARSRARSAARAAFRESLNNDMASLATNILDSHIVRTAEGEVHSVSNWYNPFTWGGDDQLQVGN